MDDPQGVSDISSEAATLENVDRIMARASTDLRGDQNYLVGVKLRAHRSIHHHVKVLKECITLRIITDPDVIYPDIAKAIRSISWGVKRVCVATTLIHKMSIDLLNNLHKIYSQAPEDIIRDMAYSVKQIIDHLEEHLRFVNVFVTRIPFGLADLAARQQLPSKELHQFFVEFKAFEENEHSIAKEIQVFFHRYNPVIQDTAGVLKNERRELSHFARFLGDHPHAVMFSIAMTATVLSYAGVFFTIGLGIATLLEGGTLAAFFGIGEASEAVNIASKVDKFLNSAGMETLNTFVEKSHELKEMALHSLHRA